MTIDFTHLYELINPTYRKLLQDYRRFQVFKGGAGAGKSVFVAQNRIYNTIVHRGFNGLAVRKIGCDNHGSTFAELNKVITAWQFDDLFDINRSKGAEEIYCKLNDNMIIFRGLDNVEKIKSVTFKTGDLSWIWFEEASEGCIDDIRQLNLRLRGKKGPTPKHMILSFNPIDTDSYLKAEFFDRKLDTERGFIKETTYLDNQFLDDEYKRELEKLKDTDQYYYQVYVLNQWGARTTARVFNNLKIHDFDIPDYKMQNLRAGADFGFNHASAFERCGFIDGELYIYDEVYVKEKLNKEFIDEIKAIHAIDFAITGDSASPDKIQEMNNAGLKVYPSKKGPDSVRTVVDWLKALPCIHIHASKCPNAAREFTRFKYREFRDGTVSDKEFVELNDDTVAAVRYAVEDMANSIEGSGHFVLKRR